MKWHNEKRKLIQLIPYSKNPRKISEKQKKDLKASLKKFDLVEIPVINLDNIIIAGHQRIKIMMLLDGGDKVIDVRVPDKQLTEEELKEYNIRSNKNTGDWDFEVLNESFGMNDLSTWGFDENELGFEENEPYTNKIKIPIYEPKNEKPDIKDLADKNKYNSLVKEIEKANISDEEKEFLKMSAYRHCIFNYSLIADYYSHADDKVKKLMENSALVIIDYDKAIENGFAEMIKSVKGIQEEDYYE